MNAVRSSIPVRPAKSFRPSPGRRSAPAGAAITPSAGTGIPTGRTW